MSKRQTQHRPQDEIKTVNRQMAELRRENHSLKKKVSRLQKYLQKLMESTGGRPEEDEVVDSELIVAQRDPNSCPTCEKTLTVVILPTGKLTACKSCGYRLKV